MLQPTKDEIVDVHTEVAPTGELAPSLTSSIGSEEHFADRLRVLHVFNHLGMGGTELTALRLMENLGSDDFEHVLCPLKGYDPEVVARRSCGAKVIVPPGESTGFQFMTPRLIRVMKQVHPHIVHSRNRGAVEAIPAARLAGVPVVIHSEHGYELTNLRGLPLQQRLMRRAVYPLADALISVTSQLGDFHSRQAWIPRDRIRVIENGIDTQLFIPSPHIRGNVREKIGIPQNRFVVGTVGRAVAIKGHGVLLRAVEMMASQGVDVHAVIAGSGPELEDLRAAASASTMSSRTSFLGAVDNVCEILHALDVFALPSFSEGMSNTLIEAMACGLPVVATRVGGNPEVLEENLSGLLFEPGDAEGLCQLLLNLFSDVDRRKALGAEARRRAVERFGLERMVDDYRKLYTGLARKRGLVTRGRH